MGIRKRGKAWLVTVELGTDERGAGRSTACGNLAERCLRPWRVARDRVNGFLLAVLN